MTFKIFIQLSREEQEIQFNLRKEYLKRCQNQNH